MFIFTFMQHKNMTQFQSNLREKETPVTLPAILAIDSSPRFTK